METPKKEPEPVSWQPGGGRACPEPLGLKAFAPVFLQVSNTRFSVAGAPQRGASPAAACDRKGKLVRLGLHRGNAANHGLFVAPLLLLAGLITACGQNAAPADEHAAANDTQTSATAINAIPEAQAAEPAAAEIAPAKAEPAATVAALPLKRGFYVESGTACGQASAATLFLLDKTSLNGQQDSCTFKKIEQTGANSYRVTEACEGGTSIASYTVEGETSFRSTSDNGRNITARYCTQSSLPDPWRDNDISDATG